MKWFCRKAWANLKGPAQLTLSERIHSSLINKYLMGKMGADYTILCIFHNILDVIIIHTPIILPDI